MKKQYLVEKSYIYIKNGIKVLSLLPFVPDAIKNLEIPLEVMYKEMQLAGWFKTKLSVKQTLDLKHAIEKTYEEISNNLPKNKRELLHRARFDIESFFIDNSDWLSSLNIDQDIVRILSKPVNLEGEFLTDNDFDNLTAEFIMLFYTKSEDASYVNKLHRHRIDALCTYMKTLDKRLSRLEDVVNHKESAQCYTDNDLYINNFIEPLFLHRDIDSPIRLCDIYVQHRYEYIDNYKGQAYGEAISKRLRPSADIMDFIGQFICNGVLPSEKSAMYLPQCLFIEGDAGIGKSSFVSYLAHHHACNETVRRDIFHDKNLTCIRLRDIIPESMRFSRNSINQDILKHMKLESREEFQKKYVGSVFILDGFDELCMIEGISARADNHIYDLYSLFEGCTLIITTRPYYLNLKSIDIPRLHIKLLHFNKNQRMTWVEKYRSLGFKPEEELALNYIENIEDDDTAGICDTPMALYMLAAGKINDDAVHNHWALYRQIFYRELTDTEYNIVFPSVDGINRHPISYYKDQIYRIGAEIAFEMFRYGNQKTYLTDGAIAEIIESIHSIKTDIKELVKRCYALSSYWKTNEDRGAVEFYHNNIRDFFLCEKICYEMDSLYIECEEMREVERLNAIKQRLYYLFRSGEINEKVVEFIYLRVLFQKKNGITTSFAGMESLRKYLPEFFLTLAYGDVSITHGENLGNAYESLSHTLVNTVQLYRHAYEPYLNEADCTIPWLYKSESINSMPMFLDDNFKKVFIKGPLSIGDNTIYTAGRANFDNIVLKGADLRFAGFSHGSIKYADLSDTILSSADFEGSDLTETFFINANLQYAKLLGCSLVNCDFTGADLAHTILPDGFSHHDPCEVANHLNNMDICGLKIEVSI